MVKQWLCHTGRGVTQLFEQKMLKQVANGIGAQMLQAISVAQQQGKPVLEAEWKCVKRLNDATITVQTLKRQKVRVNKAKVLGDADSAQLALRQKKPAALSQMRAGTNSTVLTRAMFEEILKTMNLLKHYLNSSGVAAGSPYNSELGFTLEDWMVLAGDEVGINPEGKWRRVSTYKGTTRPTLIHSEKAPFWTTVWFVTSTDSRVFPPTIIHQGEEGKVSAHNLACGDAVKDNKPANWLPSNWNVCQSPSGYMTKGIWKMTVEHLVDCLGRQRAYVLYLDGYAAHWCVEALTFLADQHIYVMFLSSQNSENDQANDNGPNLVFHVCFSDACEVWRQADASRVVIPFRACHFNEVFVNAYKSFSSGRAHGTIVSAWEKVGLFPLNVEKALDRDGALATGIWSNATPATEMMGIIIPGSSAACTVHDGKVLSPAVSLSNSEEGTVTGEFVVSPSNGVASHAQAGGDRIIRAVICTALTAQIKSTQQVQEAVRVMKQAKKVTVARAPTTVKFGRNGNPDTLTGKAFTPEVRDAMVAEYDRLAKEQEVVAAKQAAAVVEKARKTADAHHEAAAVRAALERGGMQCIIKMHAARVIAAANFILLPSEKLRSKQAALDALRPLCMAACPQQISAGQGATGRPGHFDAQIPRDNEN